jgi:hypothetical protein
MLYDVRCSTLRPKGSRTLQVIGVSWSDARDDAVDMGRTHTPPFNLVERGTEAKGRSMPFGDSCLPPPPFIPRATSAKKKGNRLSSFKLPRNPLWTHCIFRLMILAAHSNQQLTQSKSQQWTHLETQPASQNWGGSNRDNRCAMLIQIDDNTNERVTF